MSSALLMPMANVLSVAMQQPCKMAFFYAKPKCAFLAIVPQLSRLPRRSKAIVVKNLRRPVTTLK
jgi:hypothetical protein